MKILKKYVKSMLLEIISYDDNQTIEKSINLFEKNLFSSGFDLNKLDFDPLDITILRDSRNEFGLGFNPFGQINKKNNFEIVKKHYENLSKMEKKNKKLQNIIEVLKGAQAIKIAADMSGMKILGSGIFRIAFKIPQVPNVIVKIALSPSGRADNLNEIDFSLGQGAASSRHKENFSNVYSHSEIGSWMVVDEVDIFSDSLESKPEIIDNLMQNQFKNTMDLFDKTGLSFLYESFGRSRKNLFAEYINFMLHLKNEEIHKIHQTHFAKINKESKIMKNIFKKIKNIFGFKEDENPSNYIEMSDEYFKQRLCYFLIHTISPYKKEEEPEIEVEKAKKKQTIR